MVLVLPASFFTSVYDLAFMRADVTKTVSYVDETCVVLTFKVQLQYITQEKYHVASTHNRLKLHAQFVGHCVPIMLGHNALHSGVQGAQQYTVEIL